jgi:S1-C subfamily serine protease
VAYAAAVVLGIGIGFGAFAAAAGFSSSAPPSAIPAPPRANKIFVEDDNGTGADSQANILNSTVPGLVHIVSSHGTPVGLGAIITPSGLVLTTAQILRGAGHLTVRAVLSGQVFTARVIGADAAGDLALLRLSGGARFKPIAIGTSRGVSDGAAVTAVGSSGLTQTFTLHLGNLTSMNRAVTIDGAKLAGLLETTSQVLPGQETGGPLVNLSGQAIGIDVAGAGGGLHSVGFAIPIDQALMVARHIEAAHS